MLPIQKTVLATRQSRRRWVPEAEIADLTEEFKGQHAD